MLLFAIGLAHFQNELLAHFQNELLVVQLRLELQISTIFVVDNIPEQ